MQEKEEQLVAKAEKKKQKREMKEEMEEKKQQKKEAKELKAKMAHEKKEAKELKAKMAEEKKEAKELKAKAKKENAETSRGRKRKTADSEPSAASDPVTEHMKAPKPEKAQDKPKTIPAENGSTKRQKVLKTNAQGEKPTNSKPDGQGLKGNGKPKLPKDGEAEGVEQAGDKHLSKAKAILAEQKVQVEQGHRKATGSKPHDTEQPANTHDGTQCDVDPKKAKRREQAKQALLALEEVAPSLKHFTLPLDSEFANVTLSLYRIFFVFFILFLSFV